MASPGRGRAGLRAHPLLALAALGSLCAGARGCSVLRLQGSGFASNAIHVLHAVPVYDGTNGTLFLDSSRFRYACEEGGGWHDFFATQARAPTACFVCVGSLRSDMRQRTDSEPVRFCQCVRKCAHCGRELRGCRWTTPGPKQMAARRTCWCPGRPPRRRQPERRAST